MDFLKEFWRDEDIKKLNADEKYLLLYICSNTHVDENGKGSLNIKEIEEETGLKARDIVRIFDSLTAKNVFSDFEVK